MLDIPSYDWGNIESPWVGADLGIWAHLIGSRQPTKYPAKSCVFWQGQDFSTIYIVPRAACASAQSIPMGNRSRSILPAPAQ